MSRWAWGGWKWRWSSKNKEPQHDEKWKGAGKALKGRNRKGNHYFLISLIFLRSKYFSFIYLFFAFWRTLHKARTKVNNSGKWYFFAELPGKLWLLKHRNGIKRNAKGPDFKSPSSEWKSFTHIPLCAVPKLTQY